ncbi:hypothetical protein E4U31_000384 [Claviceps sp. LM219 group G6]|nr:hypothetical protein E4U31_000384 [Claviceps sp. LM219 group G6]
MFRETPSEWGIWTLEDDHLAKIVEGLGPIPPSLLKKGRRTAEFFNEKGNFLRIPRLSLSSLERLLNGDIIPVTKPPDMPDNEIDVFIDFVRGMLQIDPMARKSAAQLLQHEWLSSGTTACGQFAERHRAIGRCGLKGQGSAPLLSSVSESTLCA